MVLLDKSEYIKYNNKSYIIVKIPYKNINVPIVLNKDIYDIINKYNKNWNINSSGMLYTKIKDKNVYLNEVIYVIKNKTFKHPIIHLNKIPLDYRIENLIEDKPNKSIKKNLNKKQRTIKLKNIDVNKIPSFIWYMKDDGIHGERFQIDLGNIKWKTTSTDKLSLRYKLEEAKKYLRQYKDNNNKNFLENSMNSDLNIHGIKLKTEFYKILEKNNMYYEYTFTNNTDDLLKENLSDLTDIEKKLLKDFTINDNTTTYERLKIYF
jgi:hypothetical protein